MAGGGQVIPPGQAAHRLVAVRVSDGEVRLRVDRVGLSANNVTCAVLGQPLRYGQFFPPGPRPALRAVRFLLRSGIGA